MYSYRVHFSDILYALQSDVNHHLSDLFRVLLIPQHVSISTDHPQGVYILRGNCNRVVKLPLNVYTPQGWSHETEACPDINNMRNKPDILRL
jgi:hypothetical protein